MNETLKDTILALLARAGRKLGRALLMTGPWGAGKTFFWKSEVEPALKPRLVLYVTAFGAENPAAFKARLLAKIVLALVPEKPTLKRLTGWLNRMKGLTGALDAAAALLLKNVQVDPIQFADLLPEGTVICVDDVERASFAMGDLLAIVNILSEHNNVDVVLICNEEHILNDESKRTSYLTYKEKAISSEVHLAADVRGLFDRVLANSVSAEVVKKRLVEYKETILEVFERSKTHNVRSLIRVFDNLSLAIRVGSAELSAADVRFLTAMTLHKAEGNHEDSDFYEFNEFVFRLSDVAEGRKRELAPREKNQRAFLERYFGNEDYTFSEGIAALVGRAEVIPSALHPPPAPTLSTTKTLLKEIGSGSWRYNNDVGTEAFIVRVGDVIKSDPTLSAKDVLDLLAFARFLAALVKKDLPDEVTAAATRTLRLRAAEEDKSVGEHFHYSSDIVGLVAAEHAEFERFRNESRDVRLAAHATALMRSDDAQALVRFLVGDKTGEALPAFVSRVGVAPVMQIRKSKPEFFQSLVSLLFKQTAMYETIHPEMRKFRTDLLEQLRLVGSDPAEDLMERWRANGLVRAASE
jgi:hypothetical protein